VIKKTETDTPLDDLLVTPAPDLVVNNVQVSPSSDVQTGQTITVTWIEENRGDLPTSGAWNDRIVLNNEAGELVGSLTVPYAGSEPILAGQSVTRQAQLTLPIGAQASGKLSVRVLADVDNVVKERNANANAESNNAGSVALDVALAPYVDLVLEDLAISPDADFTEGQTVTVSWKTRNAGTAALQHGWSGQVQLINETLGQVVVSAPTLVTDDFMPLPAGSVVESSVSFVWPEGVASSGRFVVRVVVDTEQAIAEANTTGDAEDNNTAQLLRLQGPDLQVQQLTVSSDSVLQAGGLVNLSWVDANTGDHPVWNAYNDRIVVKNLDSNVVLLDTTLAYDPNAVVNGQALGAILAGESRTQQFSFRLPDGLKGSGRIGITVSSDQSQVGVGQVFETNAQGDAEANNSALLEVQSATSTYADLVIGAVQVADQGKSGESVAVSWDV
jgi:hypothetical protein